MCIRDSVLGGKAEGQKGGKDNGQELHCKIGFFDTGNVRLIQRVGNHPTGWLNKAKAKAKAKAKEQAKAEAK